MRLLNWCIETRIIRAQWVVHLHDLRNPSPHKSQIALLDPMVRKGKRKRLSSCTVPGKEEHTTSALVQPMRREDVLTAQLVTQSLHHEPRFPGVQPGAMYQPASGLVNRYQVFITPKNTKGFYQG